MSLSACYFLSLSVSHTDCASIFPTLPPSERVHTTSFFLLSWFVRMSVCFLYPSVCVCPGNVSLILLARVSAHRLVGANVRPPTCLLLSFLPLFLYGDLFAQSLVRLPVRVFPLLTMGLRDCSWVCMAARVFVPPARGEPSIVAAMLSGTRRRETLKDRAEIHR